ncbi:hypothetical protein BDC45DRAFT_535809 [Circinella umbellata]|nr:hypothetical protein BDC45DRAFT_535809 [Circinella umbellata]
MCMYQRGRGLNYKEGLFILALSFSKFITIITSYLKRLRVKQHYYYCLFIDIYCSNHFRGGIKNGLPIAALLHLNLQNYKLAKLYVVLIFLSSSRFIRINFKILLISSRASLRNEAEITWFYHLHFSLISTVLKYQYNLKLSHVRILSYILKKYIAFHEYNLQL